MRYISSVNVGGFRGLKDVSLSSLGALNILIGASNTGKSSILEAIYAALGTQIGRGLELVVRARSDSGTSMVTSLFPDNDLTTTVEISVGLPETGEGEEDAKSVEFTAKQAESVISDYQTVLHQFGWTDHDRYSVFDVNVKQTGARFSSTSQVAISNLDGKMGPRWSVRSSGSWLPVVKSLSLFLPRDLMSQEEFDNSYSYVMRSGNEAEWIERLAVLQPGLKNISPVKERDGWRIFVRISDLSLPIMSMGDGFKAASVILARTFEPGLVLIDTPELFQHPKGLSLISKSIATAASQLEAEIDTKIYRFGFENNHAKAYPPYKLQEAIDSRELIGSDLRY
jgi:hypothetical protein